MSANSIYSLLGSLDFVKGMGLAETSEELVNAFDKSIRMVGFAGTAIGFNFEYANNEITNSDQFVTYPNAWQEYYHTQNYMAEDPLIQWCMSMHYANTWSQIHKWAGGKNRVFMDAAHHSNLIDGVALPVILSRNVAIVSGASMTVIEPISFAVFCRAAQYAGTKLHLLQNGLTVPLLHEWPFDRKDFTIMAMVNAGRSNKEIEREVELSRQAVYERIKKQQKLTATETRNGPAMCMHYLGHI
ncbi:MAG: hypothetical protein GY761_16710 [Hyphomicrobiales bacterium]|nr:hypothetical protein [Hyphomicrobiales bacterium]